MTTRPCGTVAAYQAGCHCDDCKTASARHRRWLSYDHARGHYRTIDATGTRRRILALGVMRWRYSDLAAELGIYRSQVGEMASEYAKVHRDTARRVADLYDRLCMTQGPGTARTEIWARKRGGHPPLAWDDIDNPEATPATPLEIHRNQRNMVHVEDIEWLLDSGVGSWDNLTERLGIQPDSIYTACKRSNRNDLVVRLRRLTGYHAAKRAS